VSAGDASALEYVEAAGRTLIRDHVLFDMLPDAVLGHAPIAGLERSERMQNGPASPKREARASRPAAA